MSSLQRTAEIRAGKNAPEMKARRSEERKRRPLLVYVLLALPFIGLLWPAFYAFHEPVLAGLPFFYWYQLLWVFLGSAVVWGAYILDRRNGR